MDCVAIEAALAAENGTDNITDIISSSDLFQATMLSQHDSTGPSQESFNLMFQTMSYEVSKPAMCESFSTNFPDDDRGISLRTKSISIELSFFRSMDGLLPTSTPSELLMRWQVWHNS